VAFIDNMAVQCSLITGSSRAPDVSVITAATHIALARLGISVRFKYVASKSNCSDGGSRVGVSCSTARTLGVKLTKVKFPDLPRWDRVSFDGWMEYLNFKG
jgi:hypothetical protein